jgi:hypothetical protein
MDMYRKLEKSRSLNIIEGLQVPNILEICYSYNLIGKYFKKYISIRASLFCLYHLSLTERVKSLHDNKGLRVVSTLKETRIFVNFF